MKTVFLFSVIILVTGSLFAQQDAKAKEILDKLEGVQVKRGKEIREGPVKLVTPVKHVIQIEAIK